MINSLPCLFSYDAWLQLFNFSKLIKNECSELPCDSLNIPTVLSTYFNLPVANIIISSLSTRAASVITTTS